MSWTPEARQAVHDLEAKYDIEVVSAEHNEHILELLATAEAESATLRAQLPEGMESCTIQFKQCRKGHAWLTATNWVQHGCPSCGLRAAQTQLAIGRRFLPSHGSFSEGGIDAYEHAQHLVDTALKEPTR